MSKQSISNICFETTLIDCIRGTNSDPALAGLFRCGLKSGGSTDQWDVLFNTAVPKASDSFCRRLARESRPNCSRRALYGTLGAFEITNKARN